MPFTETSSAISAETQILPHHRYVHSLGAPLTCVQGTISKVFASPEREPQWTNHQHLVITIDTVVKFEGGTQNLVGTEVFVAVRFGEAKGWRRKFPDLQAGNRSRRKANTSPKPAPIRRGKQQPRSAGAALHASSGRLREVSRPDLQLVHASRYRARADADVVRSPTPLSIFGRASRERIVQFSPALCR